VITDVKIIHAVSNPVLAMDTLSLERVDGWTIVPDGDTGTITEP
jgi:hypothetical protein